MKVLLKCFKLRAITIDLELWAQVHDIALFRISNVNLQI